MAALKTSFLLGGHASDPDCQVQLERVFGDRRGSTASVVHLHTFTPGDSDINEVGLLIDEYADDVKIHLVHLGGGMGQHQADQGTRFFDWIEQASGYQTRWAIGFAPRWLPARDRAARHGHDRVLFASDEPW